MLSKEEKLEKTLYNWLNETETFENAVCDLIDKKKTKRDLIKISDKVKGRFRYLEDIIKLY